MDTDDLADRRRHDRVVELVQRVLDLNRDHPKAKTPHAREGIQRDIAATDRLVYELHSLTEKEPRIVEEGTEGD